MGVRKAAVSAGHFQQNMLPGFKLRWWRVEANRAYWSLRMTTYVVIARVTELKTDEKNESIQRLRTGELVRSLFPIC